MGFTSFWRSGYLLFPTAFFKGSMNSNLEPIRVFIWNSFLFAGDYIPGKTGGHLISVRALQNQALQFNVLLDTGALFTGLPAHSVSFREDEFNQALNLPDAQMWDCIGSTIQVFVMETLRYAECVVTPDNIDAKMGQYLFTVDFIGGGFSREPTHWKQLHAIRTIDGYFMLYPQYRIKFVDKALLVESNKETPRYKANTKQWIVGS